MEQNNSNLWAIPQGLGEKEVGGIIWCDMCLSEHGAGKLLFVGFYIPFAGYGGSATLTRIVCSYRSSSFANLVSEKRTSSSFSCPEHSTNT